MYDRSWYQADWHQSIPDYSALYDIERIQETQAAQETQVIQKIQAVQETQYIPSSHDLCEALQQEEQAYRYVQLAVCHELFAQAVLYVAQHWLWSKDLLLQSLALHYIRALGARYQCHHVLASFTSHSIQSITQINPLWEKQEQQTYMPRSTEPQVTRSYFPTAHYYYCRSDMADTYLTVLIDLLPHHHQTLLTAIDWSLQHGIALESVWYAWPKTRSHLPLLTTLTHPQLKIDQAKLSHLAIRLLLMHTHEILPFAHSIAHSTLSREVKNTFTQEVHKQCKRIGKIHLWGEIQRIFRLAALV